tara:strand:- start:3444 stop:3719 length:276 start_codon:yes stop_codon:yes gene_type:complete
MNSEQAFPNPHRTDITGMSLREYAAIKLKVPNSGTDWLDDMIRQSLKDDFAAMSNVPDQSAYNMKPKESHEAYVSRRAYELADAMLKAREA